MGTTKKKCDSTSNELKLIESSDALEKIINKIKSHRYLGVDTESDGFYSYFDKVCLVQISTPEQDIIIDTLAIDNLNPLRELLESPDIEKTFHSSNNDLLSLQRNYGYRVRNVFDTALAWQMLGHKHCGLAYVLDQELQVKLFNKSQFQRCNWAKRPLSSDQLRYARLDTHYLIPLRHRLNRQLSFNGLRDKTQQKFQKLEELTFKPKKPNPQAYLKIRDARELDLLGKFILKTIYHFRERLARRQNFSPFRILTNQSMLHMARNNPHNLQDLLCTPGLSKRFKDHQAGPLLTIIRRANQRYQQNIGS